MDGKCIVMTLFGIKRATSHGARELPKRNAIMQHVYNVCFFVETWSVRLIANLFSTFPHRKTFLLSKWAKKLQKLSQKWAATVAIGGSKSTDKQRTKWSLPWNTSGQSTKEQSHRRLLSLEARWWYYKLPRALSRRLHADYYKKRAGHPFSAHNQYATSPAVQRTSTVRRSKAMMRLFRGTTGT